MANTPTLLVPHIESVGDPLPTLNAGLDKLDYSLAGLLRLNVAAAASPYTGITSATATNRATRYEFYGTRSAVWTVIIPPEMGRRFSVKNENTTKDITVKVTSGGVGVVVKSGTTQLIEHDGTDAFPIGYAMTTTGLYIPSAHVYHNAAQSIANNTLVTLAFNSERDDNASMHDTVTNNSRLIAPIAGKYVISGNIEYAANAVGYRQLVFLKNGATNIGGILALPQTGATVTSPIAFTCQRRLAANDYVEIQANQNSGGALNVNSSADYSPEFSMTWIAP